MDESISEAFVHLESEKSHNNVHRTATRIRAIIITIIIITTKMTAKISNREGETEETKETSAERKIA